MEQVSDQDTYKSSVDVLPLEIQMRSIKAQLALINSYTKTLIVKGVNSVVLLAVYM